MQSFTFSLKLNVACDSKRNVVRIGNPWIIITVVFDCLTFNPLHWKWQMRWYDFPLGTRISALRNYRTCASYWKIYSSFSKRDSILYAIDSCKFWISRLERDQAWNTTDNDEDSTVFLIYSWGIRGTFRCKKKFISSNESATGFYNYSLKQPLVQTFRRYHALKHCIIIKYKCTVTD